MSLPANYSCPAVFGPAATTWFKFLQNNIVLKNKNFEMAARVAADQLLFAPVALSCFLGSMAVMEGTSPKDKWDANFSTVIQKNWMVWPCIQGALVSILKYCSTFNLPYLAINFKLVPLHHRVLVVNVVSLGWNCYLSFLNSQG